MATLNDLVVLARSLNNSNANQFPDSLALTCVNFVIHKIEDYIVNNIGEGYFWDILTASATVVGQNEYTIPVLNTGLFNGAPKIEGISIKYKDGEDFIPATIKNREVLLQEHDLSRYEANIPESNPIFFIADNSVFVYPSPKNVVDGGLLFYGIKSLADATLSTTYADLFGGKIPTKYYYTIADGLKEYIKNVQNKDQEAINARLDFENNILPKLADKLGNRKIGIQERQNPNLSSLIK